MDRTASRTTDVLDEFRRHAWGVAVVFFGVVDVVTTHVGLRIGGIAEVGPVAPSPQNLGVPLGLAALGGVVSAWNTVVIAVMLA